MKSGLEKTGSLVIRDYKREDRQKVFKLIGEVWGAERLERFRKNWDYIAENNPHATPDIPMAIVLLNNDELVGFIGCIAAAIKIYGKRYSLCWPVYFTVLPEYRGKAGIIMARKVVRLNCILSGFAYPGVASLWRRVSKEYYPLDIFDLHLIVKPLTSRNILRKLNLEHKVLLAAANYIWRGSCSFFFNPACPRHIKIEHITYFDDRFNIFFREAANGYSIITVRDQQHLNWRYINFPAHKYYILAATRNTKLSGYIILRCKEKDGLKTGYVVDLLADINRPETILALMCRAEEYFRREGADAIKCIEFFHPVYKEIFRKMGFIRSRKPLHSLLYLQKDYDSETLAKFTDPNNWFITLNYSDQDMGMD